MRARKKKKAFIEAIEASPDLNELTRVRVNVNTVIYLKPGADIQAAKDRYNAMFDDPNRAVGTSLNKFIK